MVAAAIVGGAIVGGVASAYGSKSAANTQANAATQNQNAVLASGQQASNLDLGALGQANGYLQPYANLGTSSTAQMQNLLTGMGNGNAMGALQSMPGYQFERQQGLEATQNGFAAKGLASSGAAMKGGAQYAQGLASTDLQNYYNQLMGGVNVGQSAATAQSQNAANLNTAAGNALMGSATNAASLGMAGATATASGQIGAANAIGNAATNAGNGYAQYQMYNQLMNPQMAAPQSVQSMYGQQMNGNFAILPSTGG